MSNKREGSQSGTPRRGFIGGILASAAAMVAAGPTARLLSAASVADDPTSRVPSMESEDWMDELTGKHRTVFDAGAHRNGRPLAQAKNYLDAWRDAFQVPEKEINLVVGVHGEAIPFVLTDALWTRFKIGEQYEVMDGGTKCAATLNVFTLAHAAPAGLISPEQTVEALQKRGVRFLICMNTIAGATRKLAAAGFGSAEEVRPAIVAGLLPGVIAVPAMVVALTQLQERGVRYTKVA